MRRIPFTQMVILSKADREAVANDFVAAAQALEESSALNMTLLQDFMAAEAKVREYANLIVTQSESAQQIMQVNLLVSGALGAIRERAESGEHADELPEFIEETVVALTASLQEFDSGAAPA